MAQSVLRLGTQQPGSFLHIKVLYCFGNIKFAWVSPCRCTCIRSSGSLSGATLVSTPGRLRADALICLTFPIRSSFSSTKFLKKKRPAKNPFQMPFCPVYWNSSANSRTLILPPSSNVPARRKSPCGLTSSRGWFDLILSPVARITQILFGVQCCRKPATAFYPLP